MNYLVPIARDQHLPIGRKGKDRGNVLAMELEEFSAACHIDHIPRSAFPWPPLTLVRFGPRRENGFRHAGTC